MFDTLIYSSVIYLS